MAILSIDTCLQACSSAVVDGHTVLAQHTEPRERGHAERLAPLVQQVLQDARIAVQDLDRIAVTIGPGSFTGVRVGLAFARGLVIGTNVPVVGLTTLEVLAAQYRIADTRDCAVLIDARRAQVYGQLFGSGKTGDPFVTEPEQARKIIADSLQGETHQLIGSGIPLAFPEHADEADWAAHQPDPVVIAQLAAEKPLADTAPSALYLRAADAKPARPLLA